VQRYRLAFRARPCGFDRICREFTDDKFGAVGYVSQPPFLDDVPGVRPAARNGGRPWATFQPDGQAPAAKSGPVTP
jgi:hypothetical protein